MIEPGITAFGAGATTALFFAFGDSESPWLKGRLDETGIAIGKRCKSLIYK
jgi:hypothetical protein